MNTESFIEFYDLRLLLLYLCLQETTKYLQQKPDIVVINLVK